MADNSLAGSWHSMYSYPSNTHDGEDFSDYDMTAEQIGNQLVLQNQPNDSGSYLLVKLYIDDVYVTGSWTESTEPNGEFEGLIYSGVIQMIVSDDRRSMSGRWVGTGRNIPEHKPGVFGGDWKLTRL